MELILIRHARAFERDAAAWPDDSRRPLTENGRDQFARFAKRLRRVAPEVDLVESSGFVRAWQTALLLEEHARWPKPSRDKTCCSDCARVYFAKAASLWSGLGHRAVDAWL